MDTEAVDYVAQLEAQLQRKDRELAEQRYIIDRLTDTIHRATKIANHLPFLCKDVEGAEPIEIATNQLHSILVLRQTGDS